MEVNSFHCVGQMTPSPQVIRSNSFYINNNVDYALTLYFSSMTNVFFQHVLSASHQSMSNLNSRARFGYNQTQITTIV